MGIDKETFINTIKALEHQETFDKHHAVTVSVAYSCDAAQYKNDTLKVTVVKLLQIHFPPTDGHCDIEHFCWILNFGKCVDSGCQVITAEDLWEILCEQKNKWFEDAWTKYVLFPDGSIHSNVLNVDHKSFLEKKSGVLDDAIFDKKISKEVLDTQEKMYFDAKNASDKLHGNSLKLLNDTVQYYVTQIDEALQNKCDCTYHIAQLSLIAKKMAHLNTPNLTKDIN